MKDLDYGKDYKYAHDYANQFVDQEFLPDDMCGEKFLNQVITLGSQPCVHF